MPTSGTGRDVLMWLCLWFYETGSLYVAQASAELNLPALASQGLRGQVCHHTKENFLTHARQVSARLSISPNNFTFYFTHFVYFLRQDLTLKAWNSTL